MHNLWLNCPSAFLTLVLSKQNNTCDRANSIVYLRTVPLSGNKDLLMNLQLADLVITYATVYDVLAEIDMRCDEDAEEDEKNEDDEDESLKVACNPQRTELNLNFSLSEWQNKF